MYRTLLLCLLSACALDELDPADPADPAADALVAPPRVVQAGAAITLLAVTSDDHAIYQDARSFFATGLAPGSVRRLVTAVADPAAATSQAFAIGKVAFVYPSLRSNASLGMPPVGSLTLWSAASGPVLATRTGIPSSFANTASRDGRSVLFVANFDAVAGRGDLVLTSGDFRQRTTLVTGMNFGAGGACMPYVGFVDAATDPYPVAAYCPAGSATPVLTKWPRGIKIDVATGLALPPKWAANPAGTHLVTVVASPTAGPVIGTSVVIGADNQPRVLDASTTWQFATFWTPSGELFEVTVEPTVNAVRRTNLAGQTTVVAPDLGVASSLVVNYAHGGFVSYRDDVPFSADGRTLLYVAETSPTTGLASLGMLALDTPSAPIVFDAAGDALPATTPYTTDSRFGLYFTYDLVDVANPLPAAFAVSRTGQARRLSEGFTTAATMQPLHGSVVAYLDRVTIGAAVTGDLVVTDVGAAVPHPVVVARGAAPRILPYAGGHGVVYTTSAGLSVASI